ncbi:NmrA domain-containing protein [Mycena chlorophos]|uniref:NmrA domain-containing protein n=1 Tax=Mycena chlorophos TaxID=658473 RepID=A0A8H6TJP5_MYCCL|nr:NmrA domain-containing protein [Mycena chlorophos]
MPAFLITSATGRQGGSAARILLAQGAQVHALVRDPTSDAARALEKLGARLFKGDLKDGAAVRAATEGVSGVFINTFPDFTNPNGEQQQAETVIAAAKGAGTVQSIVVSTVTGTNAEPDWSKVATQYPFLSQYYGSKAGAEQAVRDSGFKYTVVRPGWLMHNIIGAGVAYHFPDYRTKRVLTVSHTGNGPYTTAVLDAADVGVVVAKVLLDPVEFHGKEMDLEAETLTLEEMASQLTAVLGKEVTVKYRTEAETVEARKTLPTIDYQLWHSSKTDTSELRKLNLKLTTFKEFLEREKDAVRNSVSLD